MRRVLPFLAVLVVLLAGMLSVAVWSADREPTVVDSPSVSATPSVAPQAPSTSASSAPAVSPVPARSADVVADPACKAAGERLVTAWADSADPAWLARLRPLVLPQLADRLATVDRSVLPRGPVVVRSVEIVDGGCLIGATVGGAPVTAALSGGLGVAIDEGS